MLSQPPNRWFARVAVYLILRVCNLSCSIGKHLVRNAGWMLGMLVRILLDQNQVVGSERIYGIISENIESRLVAQI